MALGLVKWFDAEKGFGIISSPDLGESFLHISEIIGDVKPDKGTAVVFDTRLDLKKNRRTAIKCRVVGTLEDWPLVLSYLEDDAAVKLEVTVSSTGFRGRTTSRRELRERKIRPELGAQFFRGKSADEIMGVVKSYFDESLPHEKFIRYCEFFSFWVKKRFAAETANEVLAHCYAHFAEHCSDEMTFQVWRYGRQRYLGKDEATPDELPEHLAYRFKDRMGALELSLINNHSYGSEFLHAWLDEKCAILDRLEDQEVRLVIRMVSSIEEKVRSEYSVKLDDHFAAKTQHALAEAVAALSTIDNDASLRAYRNLADLIRPELSGERKKDFQTWINEVITRTCAESFIVEIWLRGITNDITEAQVDSAFFAPNVSQSRQVEILDKVDDQGKYQLITKWAESRNVIEALNILKAFLIKHCGVGYGFDLPTLFKDSDSSTPLSPVLTSQLRAFLTALPNDEERLKLFLAGFDWLLPKEFVRAQIGPIPINELVQVLENQINDPDYIVCLLQDRIALDRREELHSLLMLAKQLLKPAGYSSFDAWLSRKVDPEIYFELWKKGLGKFFPEQRARLALDSSENPVSICEPWLAMNLVDPSFLENYFIDLLKLNKVVNDRIEFYRQKNIIAFLVKQNATNLERVRGLNNPFYDIILWSQQYIDKVGFPDLASKFIYFSPDDQVRLLRRLFHLKATGIMNWSLEELATLTRFDGDLYHQTAEIHPELKIDISTDVVIQALVSYAKRNKFLIEGELLKLALHDLGADRRAKFKLGHYFESCRGRTLVDYDLDTTSNIKKMPFGEGQYYLALRFYYDEALVKVVRKLPGSKWNADLKLWGVPQKYESEVLEFARKHRFRIDFGGDRYRENAHMTVTRVSSQPEDVRFCDARLANKSHDFYQRQFWWCRNSPCFQNCESSHEPKDWEHYTLQDFCDILGLSTDSYSIVGDRVRHGDYLGFVSRINRFNRLLERLYCHHCDEILYPSDPSHFAAYTIVRFECVNSNCNRPPNTDRLIYLNHCLNGQCENVIDSRVSKTCTHGLYICDRCGSCCSHNMLSRRLSNLETNGGYIHPDLRYEVAHKLGHLERAEYFCHRDMSPMEEKIQEVFTCQECDNKYDTRKFNIKRPHRYLKNQTDPASDNLGPE